MLRCLVSRAIKLSGQQLIGEFRSQICNQHLARPLSYLCNQNKLASDTRISTLLQPSILRDANQILGTNQSALSQYNNIPPLREFHAKNSKVRYLDFRFKYSTCHYRSHLLIIRRQKMKKHRRRKWRKKYKCLLAKERLKREIAKEKAFRVELLTMIKRAEQFDPKEYALNKIREMNERQKELTPKERIEQLKELIRVNRYQVDYIKPKHKRANMDI